MKLIDTILADAPEITAIRRDLHKHPELCFHEERTADVIAKALTEEYGALPGGLVEKITGTVDRPLERIKAFKNDPRPKYVVTVDLLTTGIDVPAITAYGADWVAIQGRQQRSSVVLASNVLYAASVRAGKTGMLYRNADEFRRHLRTLIDEPARRHALAEAAHRYVREQRALANHVRRQHEWYLSLVERREALEQAIRERVGQD